MNKRSKPIASESEEAEAHLESGIVGVIAAFNLCDSIDKRWTFPTETRERVEHLCREIMGLFETGGITARRIVSTDSEFERFMSQATGGSNAQS
jgi:hypothetical protein